MAEHNSGYVINEGIDELNMLLSRINLNDIQDMQVSIKKWKTVYSNEFNWKMLKYKEFLERKL